MRLLPVPRCLPPCLLLVLALADRLLLPLAGMAGL